MCPVPPAVWLLALPLAPLLRLLLLLLPPLCSCLGDPTLAQTSPSLCGLARKGQEQGLAPSPKPQLQQQLPLLLAVQPALLPQPPLPLHAER